MIADTIFISIQDDDLVVRTPLVTNRGNVHWETAEFPVPHVPVTVITLVHWLEKHGKGAVGGSEYA